MKKLHYLLFTAVLCLASFNAFAQQVNIVKKELSQAEIDRIVKTFTSKEAEFRAALTSYVFNRSANFHLA